MSQTIQKSRRLEVRRKSKTLKNGIKRAVALSLVCTFSLQADWQDTITGLTNEAMSVWE
jgi:arginine/ornithine N-succinyltransferase beta subunit